jgi:hypothetical protein
MRRATLPVMLIRVKTRKTQKILKSTITKESSILDGDREVSACLEQEVATRTGTFLLMVPWSFFFSLINPDLLA